MVQQSNGFGLGGQDILRKLNVSLTIHRWKQTDSVDSLRTSSVHQKDCAGVTNLKLMTTNHGRQLRGSSSIGNSLLSGGSAQTAVITLSGWSGEIRGEIAVKLLRVRADLVSF